MRKCPSCRGQKKVVGLGLIEKECNGCGGVGYEKPQNQDSVKALSKEPTYGNLHEKMVAEKKRGRPKKTEG